MTPIEGWAPGPVETTRTLDPEPAQALAGLLDLPSPGERLPPLWHLLYFLDRPAQHELGPDGHPAQGHFLPPIPERRRMYAGGRLRQYEPLRCGDVVTRRSELAASTVKEGRTGRLLFTTVRHTFSSAGRTLAVEEQDLVYRSGEARPSGSPAPESDLLTGPWSLALTADPVLLFRFSALTYNAHRIHYDQRYATEVEGHAGLVVHGPLLALLLLELPRRHAPARTVGEYAFRLRGPVHAGLPFRAVGRPSREGADLAVIAADRTAVTGTARFSGRD